MNKKPYILNVDKLEVKKKYLELGTINGVAKYYNVSPSTMARYFIRMNISYIKCHKYNFDENFFSRDTQESFYLAGFLAADGNVSRTKYRIAIQLSIKDKLFLEKIIKIINFTGPIKYRTVFNSKRNSKWQDSEIVSIRFSSKIMANDLKRFNIVPAKTKIYDFPDWLMTHPLVNHFMRGYFDGDGCIGTRNNKKLRFNLCGNNSFVTKYQSILEKECNLLHNNILIRYDLLSILEYSGNIACSKIFEFLYKNSTICLQRKYDIYAPFINYKPKNQKFVLTPEEVQQKYYELKSIRKVAKYFNVKYTTIYYFIKNNNIQNTQPIISDNFT